MKVAFSAALVWVCLQYPASAMSGAELQQYDSRFASGYVFGQLEMFLGTYEKDPVLRARKSRVSECMSNARMNAESLLRAVTAFMDRNPKKLSEPAVSAVILTVLEICPSGN